MQNLLWERAQGWALNSRKEIDVISDRLIMTKQTIINSTRKKRGLLNIGGDLLKWAFGTPSNSDLVEINEKLNRLAKNNKEISHAVSDQASLVKEIASEIQISALVVSNVTSRLKEFENALLELKKVETEK